MKKLILVIVLCLVGCAEEQVKPIQSEYDVLVDIANRQAVEIAIIEQGARLNQLKQAIKVQNGSNEDPDSK